MSDNVIGTDPASDGDLGGILRGILDQYMKGVDGQLPAVVTAYDRRKNIATVRPLIAVLPVVGQAIQRPVVVSIPVLALGAGGFVINFPVKVGDKGWIEASDRDISLFKQSMREAQPNTFRTHSFSDARFIPDVYGAYIINEEDSGAMVISSVDGTTRIAISDGRVKVTASVVDIVGHTNITGGLTVDGIEFGTHKHTGVERGDAISGGPIA